MAIFKEFQSERRHDATTIISNFFFLSHMAGAASMKESVAKSLNEIFMPRKEKKKGRRRERELEMAIYFIWYSSDVGKISSLFSSSPLLLFFLFLYVTKDSVQFRWITNRLHNFSPPPRLLLAKHATRHFGGRPD